MFISFGLATTCEQNITLLAKSRCSCINNFGVRESDKLDGASDFVSLKLRLKIIIKLIFRSMLIKWLQNLLIQHSWLLIGRRKHNSFWLNEGSFHLLHCREEDKDMFGIWSFDWVVSKLLCFLIGAPTKPSFRICMSKRYTMVSYWIESLSWEITCLPLEHRWRIRSWYSLFWMEFFLPKCPLIAVFVLVRPCQILQSFGLILCRNN